MNKKFTRILCSIMFVLCSLSLITIPVIAEENIKVVLNGTDLTFDVPPQVINSRTMVPMRSIFEAMGAAVHWDKYTQTITATKDDTVITMQIDNVVIFVSSKEITLDVSPQLIDGITFVPVRAVAEGLDAKIDWVDETQTVVITKEEKTVATPSSTSEAGTKLPKSKYHYSELSDSDMKKLKDSYNELLQIFENSALPDLKNNASFAKEIKAKSDVVVKLVQNAWNKVVTTQIIKLQIDSNDNYDIDSDPNVMQEYYLEIVKKSGLEANNCLEISFMELGDGSVTMFLDFKKQSTHFVIPVIAGENNTIEILQSKEMKEFFLR